MSPKMHNTNKCAACSRDVTAFEQLKCNTCSLKYHFECVNNTSKRFKDIPLDYKTTWVCPSCCIRLPKGDNSNTPIRSICNIITDVSPTTNITLRRNNHSGNIASTGLSLENVKELIQESMDSLLDKMEKKITNILELKTREIFKDMENFINMQYEDIKRDYQLKCTQIKQLCEENLSLKTTAKDLSNRLSIMEQHSRLSNLELQCIPEHKAENLVNVVIQVAKVTGNKLQEGDIHKCTRIAKINPENKRPRSVVVKFSSPRVRDTFMASVIQFNKKHRNDKLNTSHIGFGGEKKPIYVVDHLTPEVKKIHAMARECAKRLNYKFVWTRNGRVFMRKTETSEHIMIRDLSILESLS